MKILVALTSFATLLMVQNAARATEIYHLDFTPPELGTYNTVFGTPTVQSSAGPFTDALVFHAVTTYDQIELPINTASEQYNIQCDLLTHNLKDSGYRFTVLLDTPEIRTVSWEGDTNSLHASGPQSEGFLNPFHDDQVYHLEISLYFPGNNWTVLIDGTPLYSGVIDATALNSIRFSLAPRIIGTASQPGTYAALDNVVVDTVPEPGAGVLACSALALLGSRRLFRRAGRR